MAKKEVTSIPKPIVPAGILDGNGRTARLARWLRELPKRKEVDTLVLELKTEDGWQRVQSWDRADAGMHLALPIDSAVTDLANEIGAYSSFKIAWYESKSGAYWTEHALRAQPDGLTAAQSFSGDAQSAAIQTQRALERLVGQFMGGLETASTHLQRQADNTQQLYEHTLGELTLARERIARLERQVVELEAQVSEVEAQRDEALERAEELAKTQAPDPTKAQIGQFLQAAVMQSLAKVSGGGGNSSGSAS